jgi:release factor glutamine methyltransferase
MNNHEWLRQATKRLQAAGIGTARLDSLVLLEDSLKKDRSWLLAHQDFRLDEAAIHNLDLQLVRREKHEPLAYIREKCEFFGREFYVNSSVLVPRSESETMVELLKQVAGGKQKATDKPSIIDIGTGSGALAITAQLELPQAEVAAIDIDPACLGVAKTNVKRLKATIKLHQGDLVSPFLDWENIFALLCNLPYVPESYHINEAAGKEPRIAIFGGTDGLDLYRRLFKQIDAMASKPRYILTESLPMQHTALTGIAHKHGYRQQAQNDFIQVFNLE